MSDWRPTASIDTLRLRAKLLADVRDFFAERGVMEVETPALCETAVTDVHIHAVTAFYSRTRRYLHTSPEYAMKRLLAAGSGDIYQICRVFRDGESGRHHNPEFTLLEWYRTGFDHHALMEEVALLLQRLLSPALGEQQIVKISYRDAMQRFADLDPFRCESRDISERLSDLGIAHRRDDAVGELLDLLTAAVVQPQLGKDAICLIFDYPPDQAALARIRPGTPSVAERFEAYCRGQELANGFHELTDHAEQRRRFEQDVERRRHAGLIEPDPDERLLAALKSGLPACAGVAMGIDRVVMVSAGLEHIDEAMAFPISRA